MSSTTPPIGQPIQLVGYSWRSGALELIWRCWPEPPPTAATVATNDPLAPAAEAAALGRWPLPAGAALALAARAELGAPGERRCVGYQPPSGGPRRLCPEWRAIPAGRRAQCAACEQREERLEIVASDGSRPPTGPHAAYLREAHEVYLAA